MKIEQLKRTDDKGWDQKPSPYMQDKANFAFVFGPRDKLSDDKCINEIRALYPKALCLGCTGAGVIYGTQVSDSMVVVTAVYFEHTALITSEAKFNNGEESFSVGESLGKKLPKENLAHVFVISDGLHINGSELVAGIMSQLPTNIVVTGGLAGDGTLFKKTLVFLKDKPESKTVAIVGFYGDRLKVGYGSQGGWDTYGLVRKVTRSKGNVLYELDNKPALVLYKKYLGEKAKELPSSALLFPLNMRVKKEDDPIVRTVLAINEEENSMTFAGDIHEGSYVQLMKANLHHLVDGACGAANTSYHAIRESSPDLAILISCVGRKLVLKQRIEEETEAVREVLGDHTIMTGFYSYGEISPHTPQAKCQLHNQTMTITVFSEM
jgi:hypothetical protein